MLITVFSLCISMVSHGNAKRKTGLLDGWIDTTVFRPLLAVIGQYLSRDRDTRLDWAKSGIIG